LLWMQAMRNNLAPIVMHAAPKPAFAKEKILLIGYARVSTDGQDLATPRDTLLRTGCQRIYEEKVSGAVAGKIKLA
jgi:hypothetical protein